MKLVRSGSQKKKDPLKKKKDRSDFKVTGKNANAAYQPPNFDPAIFNLNNSGIDGMNLEEMTFAGDSQTEVSESDYDSEFQRMGMMSPAGDQSDASHIDYNMFQYGDSGADGKGLFLLLR